MAAPNVVIKKVNPVPSAAHCKDCNICLPPSPMVWTDFPSVFQYILQGPEGFLLHRKGPETALVGMIEKRRKFL